MQAAKGMVSIFVFVFAAVLGGFAAALVGGSPVRALGAAAGIGAVVGLVADRSLPSFLTGAIGGIGGGLLLVTGLVDMVQRSIAQTFRFRLPG